MTEEILVVKNLTKHFKTDLGLVRAVDGIDFTIKRGETFGLVGESGSGKSTVAYTIMGIYDPTDGEIIFNGNHLIGGTKKRPLELKREMQMVFQDPSSSLNPRHNVRTIIELPLNVHNLYKGNELERIKELLNTVGLTEDYLNRYPRAIGGGEKQLVAIARALAPVSSFIALDEPTSSLDVSMQAKIITKLIDIQKELNLSYLFITHNLSLMRNVATRVGIMYLGKIVEIAPTGDFFRNPLHPYTKMLLSSIPVITDEEEALKPDKVRSVGEIPSPVNMPTGCTFHTRCIEAMEKCSEIVPTMVETEPDHFVNCHLFSDSQN